MANSDRAQGDTSDQLVSFGDRLFEEWSPYPGDGLRNHCLRLHHFVQLLAAHNEIEFDPGLSHAIAMVHDLGLVCPRNLARDYMRRSWALWHSAAEALPSSVQAAAPQRVARECLVFNHRLSRVPNLLPTAELFRQAVWIEHSRGVKRYGLDAGSVRAVFSRFPRANLDRVLLDFFWRTVRYEPGTIAHGIFA